LGTLPSCGCWVLLLVDHEALVWATPRTFRKHLNLAGSKKGSAIGPEGGRAFANSLRTNTTLQTLSIYGNFIGQDSGAEICEALKENRTLSGLNMGNNELGEAVETAAKAAWASTATRSGAALILDGHGWLVEPGVEEI
jgi:hypothetical protein